MVARCNVMKVHDIGLSYDAHGTTSCVLPTDSQGLHRRNPSAAHLSYTTYYPNLNLGHACHKVHLWHQLSLATGSHWQLR